MSTPSFDAANYWRSRMQRTPSLVGTGWIGIALPWQHSLYAAKRRAIRRLLRDCNQPVAGRTVLDFGCGTGYFEDVWEAWGATHTSGIDIAPTLIDSLSERFPSRDYACVDLAAEDVPFGAQDLVTALDVLYHVVDDEAAERIVARLLNRVAPGGAFVATDGWPRENRFVAVHVRHRSPTWWAEVAKGHGFQIAASRPVYVLHNRDFRGMSRLPGFIAGPIGWMQYAVDAALLRLMPGKANMRAFVLTRDA